MVTKKARKTIFSISIERIKKLILHAPCETEATIFLRDSRTKQICSFLKSAKVSILLKTSQRKESVFHFLTRNENVYFSRGQRHFPFLTPGAKEVARFPFLAKSIDPFRLKEGRK